MAIFGMLWSEGIRASIQTYGQRAKDMHTSHSSAHQKSWGLETYVVSALGDYARYAVDRRSASGWAAFRSQALATYLIRTGHWRKEAHLRIMLTLLLISLFLATFLTGCHSQTGGEPCVQLGNTTLIGKALQPSNLEFFGGHCPLQVI